MLVVIAAPRRLYALWPAFFNVSATSESEGLPPIIRASSRCIPCTACSFCSDVDSGGITIDGVDVRQWNLETLRRQISIIEQDIFLFSRSIAENIAFGKPQATRAEIEQAARAAQAHDFIMSFPDEYETVVGERGMTLSGGQRQRIALARAFLTDPAILILDDSTSAIDSATEDQIQQAIERATEGRTTILITHRLSQIRWADQIVVLRKGSVAAQGSHAELIERSQPYRDIFARL